MNFFWFLLSERKHFYLRYVRRPELLRDTFSLVPEYLRGDAERSEGEDSHSLSAELSGGAGVGALPPAPGLPVNDFIGRGRETAGVVEPSSVTENTTKLLDEK